MKKNILLTTIISLLLTSCDSPRIVEKTEDNKSYLALHNYPIVHSPKHILARWGISFRKMPDNRLAAYIVLVTVGGGNAVPYEKPQVLIKTTKNGVIENQLMAGYVLRATDCISEENQREEAFQKDELNVHNKKSPIRGKDIWGTKVYWRSMNDQAYAFEVPLSAFTKIANADKTEIVVQTKSDPYVFELEKDEDKILPKFLEKL